MSLIKAYIVSIVHEFLFAVCILFIPGIAMASSADGKAIEGMELYRKNAFGQASQKFLEARQGKPNDPKISYNLGNSRYKEGKFDQALQDYSSLIDLKSDSALKQKSAYNMGNALFRMDKLDKSVVAYKKALELDPNDMDAKFNLEFVREQIEKKKKEQQKQDKSGNDKKNQEENDQQNQTQNPDNSNNPSNQQKPPFQDKQEQNNSQNNPSDAAQALRESMTKEEADQKLNALTEDLKKFQRKQALDVKSIFTYQGNDW